MKSHFYSVDVVWTSDRKGMLFSPEVTGVHTLKGGIEVATPPEFPKGVAGIWSPEHLFTAAIGSCLMTTFLAVAENSKLEFIGFTCRATGRLEQTEGKWLITEVVLEPKVVVKKQEDVERAQKVLLKSEANCLISNSVNARIVMKPEVQIQLEHAQLELKIA